MKRFNRKGLMTGNMDLRRGMSEKFLQNITVNISVSLRSYLLSG